MNTQLILKRLRDSGMSQMSIHRKTGIPQPTLSRWEAGDVPESADAALRLLALYKTKGRKAPDA